MDDNVAEDNYVEVLFETVPVCSLGPCPQTVPSGVEIWQANSEAHGWWPGRGDYGLALATRAPRWPAATHKGIQGKRAHLNGPFLQRVHGAYHPAIARGLALGAQEEEVACESDCQCRCHVVLSFVLWVSPHGPIPAPALRWWSASVRPKAVWLSRHVPRCRFACLPCCFMHHDVASQPGRRWRCAGSALVYGGAARVPASRRHSGHGCYTSSNAT